MKLALLILACSFSLYAATGEIVAAGTAIGSAGTGGTSLSNLFDGDLTTSWAAGGAGTWGGLDLGSGNALVLTRYRIAPTPTSVGATDYSFYMQNGTTVIQASNDCTFATGTVTLDTIPSTLYYQNLQLTERAVSGSTGYRCFRFTGMYLSNLAELQFIGTVSAGTPSGSPVPPVISQWGGIYPSGTASITMTSRTTSASIYYTTDGTMPSNTHGTLYAGTFNQSTGSALTLKAVSYDATLSISLSVFVSPAILYNGFQPISTWYDQNGNPTQAYDGGMTWDPASSKYYWVGVPISAVAFGGAEPGVNMYSSPTGSAPWTFVGMILNTPGNTSFAPARCHIIQNVSNSTCVMWCHDQVANLAMTATATTITGPWTWQNTALNPDGLGFKDDNLFLDTTGTAYVIYTNGSQNAIEISQLSTDFLSAGISHVTVFGSTNNEAPVMWKNGSVYFVASSVQNFYDSTLPMSVTYLTASSPLGTYSGATALFASSPTGTNYNGQPTAVVTIQGTGQQMLMGDFWYYTPNFPNSREVWLPLTYPTSTSVVAGVPASWNLTVSGSGGSSIGSGFLGSGVLQ